MIFLKQKKIKVNFSNYSYIEFYDVIEGMKNDLNNFINNKWEVVEQTEDYKISSKEGERGLLAFKGELKIKASINEVI